MIKPPSIVAVACVPDWDAERNRLEWIGIRFCR